MNDTAPLRIGILGAARIAPMALVAPARRVPEAAIAAIAARDVAKARRFATKHGIAKVHDSYDALLADPGIDAVYNPLPNGLHCEWTIRALRAGKHVLCEKPIASNEGEAARMAEAARETGCALVEAFHWRYHPLATRMQAILASGAIGAPRHYEAWFAIPLVMRGDIRWRLDLAGGALMDTGCYPISMVRHLAGAEPEVVSAKALLRAPGVDRRVEAELRFADGRTAKIGCSMWSSTLLRVGLRVTGERGEMRVLNPLAPHLWHRLRVTSPGGTTTERIAGESTYTHQLRAFVDHVRRGTPVPTGAQDGVANMRVIDAIYRAAGLRPRGT
ncbi:MAG: Gfo/Idh/MocA family oxidoreductase [Myxococcota bacterium]|jgi:predicted dehydrogenase|nr:Gfo/Idh/MocA family oxidoreductase [Myxococcota bacterium]